MQKSYPGDEKTFTIEEALKLAKIEYQDWNFIIYKFNYKNINKILKIL